MKNKNIFIAILINLFITASEAVIGFFIGSLALVSDAVHNFSDVGAMSLSWWGEKIKEKSNNKYKTYGYKRAEILIALFNSLVLLGVVVFIIFESIDRLFNPEEIAGGAMIVMALIALIGNTVATHLLERDSHRNLNLKSAWLHSFQDALFSLGVVVGSVLVYYFHWYFIDPIISILLSIYILKEVYGLIKQTVDILMESVPVDISFEEVKAKLEKLPKVMKVHDIHIWQTDSVNRYLSTHLEIEDVVNGERNQLLCDIQDMLDKDFKISHTTIQLVANINQDGCNLKCSHCN